MQALTKNHYIWTEYPPHTETDAQAMTKITMTKQGESLHHLQGRSTSQTQVQDSATIASW